MGSVTLNEQTLLQSSDQSTLTVVMIHVSITKGKNAGTDIVIGDVLSGIKSLNVPATVGGFASSPTFTPDGGVRQGAFLQENIPCFGTHGVVQTNSYPYGSYIPYWEAGTITETGTASLTATETSVETTSSIANLVLEVSGYLPQGSITATSITSHASGTTTDGVTFNFSGGSTFEGLTVPGYPAINDDVAPNTVVQIPKLGNLYFNVVDIGVDAITIIPIKLVVTANNSGLGPAGTELLVDPTVAQLYSTHHP